MLARRAKPRWGKQHRLATIDYKQDARRVEDISRIRDQVDSQKLLSIISEE